MANLAQNTNIDPNSDSSITAGANASIQSSAPQYQPLVTGTTPALTGGDGIQYGGNTLNQTTTNAETAGAFNPSVSPNETLTYQNINNPATQNYLYGNSTGYAGDGASAFVSGAQSQPLTFAGASQTAPVTNPNGVSNYNAVTTNGAQGTVDPNSLVQNQFTSVMNSDVGADGIPDWARNAVTAADQQMAARGLGASTMAGNATASAILATALPMAQQNAQVYAQLNSQNLSNSQQAMLSNQAATNAAQQFNASSANQINEFFSNLSATMADQNAQRATAVSQFNAGQQNSYNEFLQNLNNQQAEFNAQNALQIEQSNVQWNRAINTANTAGINAVNQANAQNLFNMSQTDQNNLWQQARDEASWALTSSENSQNRGLSFVNSALNRSTSLQILSSQMTAQLFSSLGSLATNLLGSGSLGNLLGGSGSAINNLFNGSGSGFGGGGPNDINSINGGSDFGSAGGGPGGDFGGGGDTFDFSS